MGCIPPSLILLAFAAALAGCRGEPPAASPGPSVAAQTDAVKAGRTATITATAPLSAAEWEGLRGLAGLRVLVLEAGRADDERAAAILATLPAIERLVLRQSPLGDAGFAALARLHTLRDLNLPQADCTAAGVRALAALPSLRALRLGGSRLAGVEVGEALATLPHLRSLHLIEIPLGDAGLEALAGIDGLWSLYLDGAGVSDDAWSRYFQQRPGVHVHVDQAHHDRDPGRHAAPHDEAERPAPRP